MSHGLSSPLGLIAGSGSLPIEFARAAKEQGLALVTAAHVGESDPVLESMSQTFRWVRVGQLGKLLSLFSSAGVKQVAFAGGIARVKLFSGARPDWRAVRLITKIGSVRDDEILRGIAGEFEKRGIQVISAGALLQKNIPGVGVLTKRSLTEKEKENAALGWKVCKAIGRYDVGQTVIVTQGVVSAVEAVEGTDKAILRAGELAGKGGVIVKLAKPQQDLRLDLPTIGVNTIASMKAAGATALVLEAGKAIVLEPAEVVRQADAAGIAVVVLAGE